MAPRSSAKSRGYVQAFAPDLAMLTVILLSGLVYTFGIDHFLDIRLFDESRYLHSGITLPQGSPGAQRAPLYALWYYMLSLIQPDPAQLYFLNYRAMSILPFLLVFCALRANRVSRVVSLLCAIGLLVNFSNFPTWPKVNHFALLVLLCGITIVSPLTERRLQTLGLVVTALLASFVRPEFFISFILLSLLYLVMLLGKGELLRTRRVAVPLLIAVAICLILMFFWGIPLGEGDRTMVAFGQHYAVNWVSWHDDLRNPWTNWKAIVYDDFGAVSTPIEALRQNPTAVVRHIMRNISRIPAELIDMFGKFYPISEPALRAFQTACVLFFGGWLIMVWTGSLKTPTRRIVDNSKKLAFMALQVAAILTPIVLSVILIAPRRHYLLILGVISALGLVVLVFRETSRPHSHLSYSFFCLVCLLPLLVIRPITDTEPLSPRDNVQTIDLLRSLNIAEPVDILDAEGGIGIYIGDQYTYVPAAEKEVAFSLFLQDRSIDMVILSNRLVNDARYNDDPEWLEFTGSPSSSGFILIDIPDVADRSVLVKGSLLQQSEK